MVEYSKKGEPKKRFKFAESMAEAVKTVADLKALGYTAAYWKL